MTDLYIELVYEKTCPNTKASRTQLLQAFNQLGLDPIWTEWEVTEEDTPEHIHGYGSPTILVNGKDVAGEQAAKEEIATEEIDRNDMCCRIYANSDADNNGVPTVDDIVMAIKATQSSSDKPAKKFLGLNMAMLPAVGLAFLPKLFCPACWPAYAGLLSSFGIGFFDYTPYILPAMALFIVIAIFALAYKAKQRRGYQPLYLGLVASGILLSSKFYWDNDIMMWTGLVLLISSSLWNTWPKQSAEANCPACQV